MSRATDEASLRAKPLAGRRIVVTRAPEQARELTQRLQELGATVISLPAVSFAEPEDFVPLDAAIAAIASFDWILFTSANAVKFFARRCRARGMDPKALQSASHALFVAAVGPATSEAVAAEGLLVNHMAEEFQGAALARELTAELGSKKVLLPRGDKASPELQEALRAAGANVTAPVCYRTLEFVSAEPAALETLQRGEVDVVSFFSGSAFRSLVARVGIDCLRRIAIAAIGPVTAAEIRAAGLPVAVEAPQATTSAFIAALVDHFSVRSQTH